MTGGVETQTSSNKVLEPRLKRLLFLSGQVPIGFERGGSGAVHAEPAGRVRHRYNGRHGGAPSPASAVLEKIILILESRAPDI